MAQKKKKEMSQTTNSPLLRNSIRRWFPLFLLPTFAAFCVGFIYPFLKGTWLSFCTFKTTSDAKFLGFDRLFYNYVQALKDETFLHAFWFTALFAVVSVVLINFFAFLFAYFFTLGIKGTNLFRTAFFMPNLIGGIVLGYIWSVIFDGILQHYGTNILADSRLGFWGLMILLLWQQIGYMMIIYIAGLQSVPEELMEAARIDGATRFQTLIKVTIPNVMSSITVCMFLTLTNGFKLFDQNLALTGGQPYTFGDDGKVVHTTEMLALNIYDTFYGSNTSARGQAQAKAVMFFILVAGISLIQLKATRSKEVQQ